MTAVLFALTVLLPGATCGDGWIPLDGPTYLDALECASMPQQSVLEGVAWEFADAWVGKDTKALGEAMNPQGIRLHLPEEEHQQIRPRQAGAALGSFLEDYAGGDAQVTGVSLAGSSPDKGYAEIRWTTGSPGATEPVIFTLFVAYALDSEKWLVTEIRVLF